MLCSFKLMFIWNNFYTRICCEVMLLGLHFTSCMCWLLYFYHRLFNVFSAHMHMAKKGRERILGKSLMTLKHWCCTMENMPGIQHAFNAECFVFVVYAVFRYCVRWVMISRGSLLYCTVKVHGWQNLRHGKAALSCFVKTAICHRILPV